MTIGDFLNLLKGVRTQGDGWIARCPAHDDRSPSLGVAVGVDSCTLITCYAGCSPSAITDALNLTLADLFITPTQGARPQSEIAYNYRGESGELVYQVIRKPSKKFSQRRPDGNGGWIYSLRGVRRVLYRLPELLAANSELPVFICEGEKDCDRLASLGLITTTNSGGAGKWRKEHCEPLHSRRVVILPDNDDPGREHAQLIAGMLNGCVRDLTIIELPGLKSKGDVSDWLDAGGDVRDLFNGKLRPELNEHKPPPSPPPTQTGNAQGKTYNTTDMGNAERFYDLHGNAIRYCSHLGKDGNWLIWDGRRWKIDHTLQIHSLAKDVVPMIYGAVAEAETSKEKKRLFNWAVRTEGLAARNNFIKDTRPTVAIEVNELDCHPWLLNAQNGTLDLRTGGLAKHSQADKLTKMVAADFDSCAECPLWMEFLGACMANNQELVSYLQKIVGYSLTGDVSEKAMFVMHGPKDTGKTTFVETLQSLIGEYSAKIQTQTLMWQRERNATNDIARLKGARFVYACESEENEHLAESRIKEMTGGDTLIARFLHAEFFQFEPEFKIWLATNNKPRVSNDDAIWGRLKLIPFAVKVPEDRKDKKLKHKLRAELAGILRWAVDGCLMWQRDGLAHPDDVIRATRDYRGQMDVIGFFIDECCELGEFFRISSRGLYGAYKQWCDDSGEKIESQRALGLKLKDRNLTNEMATSGQQKGRSEWIGIKLK